MLIRRGESTSVLVAFWAPVLRFLPVQLGTAFFSFSGRCPIWEFPEIRGHNIDPKVVGLLVQGHPRDGPPMYRNNNFIPSRAAEVLYPKVAEFVSSLHKRRISTFFVTNGQCPVIRRGASRFVVDRA